MQRIITRRSDLNGSVVTFEAFGEKHNLLVADAKFRFIQKWCIKETVVPSLKNFKDDIFELGNPLSRNLSDSELQAMFPSFSGDYSSLLNTDVLVGYLGTYAAKWCRAYGFDLPTIHELMIIYLESDRLDELDPTLEKYPQYALGMRNPNGRFNFSNTGAVWSSTKFDNFSSRCIFSNGSVDKKYNDSDGGIVPVKELSEL